MPRSEGIVPTKKDPQGHKLCLSIVVFGASGDLAMNKTFPSIAEMEQSERCVTTAPTSPAAQRWLSRFQHDVARGFGRAPPPRPAAYACTASCTIATTAQVLAGRAERVRLRAVRPRHGRAV